MLGPPFEVGWHEDAYMTAELHPHDLAELLPMMRAQEFEALRRDMADVGQQEPILLFEGKILDGRNRYRACRDLGIEPKTEEFAGNREDALKYVVSANLQRRQLRASQRAVVGLRLLPMVREEVHKARLERLREAAKRRSERALWEDGSGKPRANLPTAAERGRVRVRKIVADMLGIADRLIADAQFLSEKDPAALRKVEAGEMRLHAAVAPLRKHDGPRRGRRPDPLRKALGLLRKAQSLLAPTHREAAKALAAVAAKIDKGLDRG
jgi:hypothetical protein